MRKEDGDEKKRKIKYNHKSGESLTRYCGLTIKHLQRRTPRSAVHVVVRHFGAKAGRVVSS